MTRWEKLVNRRYKEAVQEQSAVKPVDNISLDEKEYYLRRNGFLTTEDFAYIHADDATEDEFSIGEATGFDEEEYYKFKLKEDGTSLYYTAQGPTDDDIEQAVFERVMTFMPNSKAVGVKKKCQLAGNGDGTSEPCNQGEIENIELSTIKENKLGIFEPVIHEIGSLVKEILLERTGDIKYGVVMQMFDIKNWKNVLSEIKEEDIYDKEGYGLEKEAHVTVLYGFHSEVGPDQIRELIGDKIKKPVEIKIIGVSIFESDDYDVVKFDVESEELVELNKILKKLPYTNKFKDYKPHMTISYVKKGTGKKYVEKFKKPIVLKSNKFVHSDKGKNKKTL